MSANAFGEIVNGLIPLLGGLYAWMLGTRRLGKPVGVDYDARLGRFTKTLTLMGPLAMLYGLSQIVMGLVRR
mgnify:FL=1